MKSITLIIIMSLFAYMPGKAATGDVLRDAEPVHRALKAVTDIMVHDIYSPPVASRIYAYVSVAGYEAAVPADQRYLSLAGQLHSLQPAPSPALGKPSDFTVAAVEAMLVTAKALVISEDSIERFRLQSIQEFRKRGITEDQLQQSLVYGDAVAAHILAWAAKDYYRESKSLPQYTVTEDDASWKPTPPAYMKAIEPNWNKLRTMVVDSAQAFKPAPAVTYAADTGSVFYKNAVAVYKAGLQLTAEQIDIAKFWDCNPFNLNVRGHVMFATKKISPGGHWINITRIACEKMQAGVLQTLEAYAWVAVTINDAFISCWDEKYRSRVVRPETFINRFIDEAWTPLLQTPPFPEYTSGHSVVSMAAATILNKLFGQSFEFLDASEMEFGLPARNFSSFEAAAREAAISRFYGGIHYMPSIENGVKEGAMLGRFIAAKLITRK